MYLLKVQDMSFIEEKVDALYHEISTLKKELQHINDKINLLRDLVNVSVNERYRMPEPPHTQEHVVSRSTPNKALLATPPCERDVCTVDEPIVIVAQSSSPLSESFTKTGTQSTKTRRTVI